MEKDLKTPEKVPKHEPADPESKTENEDEKCAHTVEEIVDDDDDDFCPA